MCDYEQKIQNLKDRMEQYAGWDVAVAFSGGVDSALLLKMACEAAEKTGKRVYAITMQTRLYPAAEADAAGRMSEEMGAESVVLAVDELHEAGIMHNPVERCYLCKKYLFLKMLERAKSLSVDTVLDGTNADDLLLYRPGIRALRELQIGSPLADAGMTKEEVRRLAAEYGLSVAAKPANPCLATRFPYGTPLSYEKLRRVEQGEAYLEALGFHNIRIRVHDDIARIEVDEAELSGVLLYKKEITAFLKNLGYAYITLDIEGFRSGSMDMGLTDLPPAVRAGALL